MLKSKPSSLVSVFLAGVDVAVPSCQHDFPQVDGHGPRTRMGLLIRHSHRHAKDRIINVLGRLQLIKIFSIGKLRTTTPWPSTVDWSKTCFWWLLIWVGFQKLPSELVSSKPLAVCNGSLEKGFETLLESNDFWSFMYWFILICHVLSSSSLAKLPQVDTNWAYIKSAWRRSCLVICALWLWHLLHFLTAWRCCACPDGNSWEGERFFYFTWFLLFFWCSMVLLWVVCPCFSISFCFWFFGPPIYPICSAPTSDLRKSWLVTSDLLPGPHGLPWSTWGLVFWAMAKKKQSIHHQK